MLVKAIWNASVLAAALRPIRMKKTGSAGVRMRSRYLMQHVTVSISMWNAETERGITWMLSVSEDLLTLTRWSCPLARFLALALKTSASRSCCSLYLTSRCPLEHRAKQFSTDFHQDKQTSTCKSSSSSTTKLSLKRIIISSPMTNTNKQTTRF